MSEPPARPTRIAALIAVAAIAAMQGLGNNLKKTFNNVFSNMKTN